MNHRMIAGHGRVAGLIAGALLFAGCAGGPSPGTISTTLDPAEVEARLAELATRSVQDPANAEWPYRAAELRRSTGDDAGAEAELRGALGRDPNHAPSLSLLSEMYWVVGRHDEAITALENRRGRGGSMPEELEVALALHYEAAGRTDEAAALAASLEPRVSRWEETGAALTYLRLRGDDYRTSADVAERALRARPESAVNRNNWGISKLYAGDPVAARKAFLDAIEIDPELPGPFYNLAIVDRFYRFDDASAREWFQRYLALDDEDPDGLAEVLAVELSADTTGAKLPAAEGVVR